MTTIHANTAEDVSLDNCDNEPVHIPGHIQGFAVCLSTDEGMKTVRYCSENSVTLFNKTPQDILGKDLTTVFDDETIHDINNALSLSSARVQRERSSVIDFGGKNCEIWVHFSGVYPVIEIEMIPSEKSSLSQSIRNVRSLLAYLVSTDDLQTSFKHSVDGLRSLSEFDRVMLYQFDANGNGDIKAESKGPGLESFLGLRFPSWDIPKQAREMLKKMPLRLIADVNGAPVPLINSNPDEEPLDLSLAACRGQSPIHSEYLKNMGVESTMTLSIVVNGELWGLFAFHHMSPRVVGPSLRGAAELFVQFFSLQLEQRIEKKRNTIRATTRSYENALFSESTRSSDVTELVAGVADSLCELVEADGLSVISANDVVHHGITASSKAARQLVDVLSTSQERIVATTDSIKQYGLDGGDCAGAMLVPIGQSGSESILFFRRQASLSVTWAGAPQKDIIDGDDGPKLIPRKSFQAYKKSHNNKSQPWEQDSLTAASELNELLTEVELDRLLAAGRQRAIYVNELNHRVRNILALVRTLVRRTTESSTSFEAYAISLEQRIAALGAAHDLSANPVSDGIGIKTIFEMEAKPFISSQSQLNFSGKDVFVRPSVAPLFALITHELMTNCVKHGALSVPNGKINVTLETDAEGARITWQEFNGPTTKKPTKLGFGFNLIETSVPYELDGTSVIEFLPEGLRAVFTLSKANFSDAENLQQRIESTRPIVLKTSLTSALILEDSVMVALDMEDMLKHLGFNNIKKCPSVATALKEMQSDRPDIGILDINLRDEQCFAVAEEFQKLSIPFCFATGFGSQYELPEKFNGTKIITKPIGIDTLESAIEEISHDR